MAYQFLHIETYSEATQKVKGTTAHFNSAAQVLGEAMRAPEYSKHVEKPGKPYQIGGTLSVQQLNARRSAILNTLRETVTLKDGATYSRKLRKDAATLYTEIHSHPLPASDFMNAPNEHHPDIKNWYQRALIDFKERMPDSIDWSAIMHLDEGFVHFHILAINIDDPKLDANKLHVGKAASAKLRCELEIPSALASLPKPELEKRPNKPKQPRPSKNRETQRKNKIKRETQLAVWSQKCDEFENRNATLMAKWEATNSVHLKTSRKQRGPIPEKLAYTNALKGLQDQYYEKVGKPCGLLRDGPGKQRLSTQQYAAQQSAAQRMKTNIKLTEINSERADSDAGHALEIKERYAQKEVELDEGITALDELVTQIASGDATITKEGLTMIGMPPFFERLFGPDPSSTKVGNLFLKLVDLIGRLDGSVRDKPDVR